MPGILAGRDMPFFAETYFLTKKRVYKGNENMKKN